MRRLALRPCRHGPQTGCQAGRQAAQRMEELSRGSQRATSDTQEPQERRWEEEERMQDERPRKKGNRKSSINSVAAFIIIIRHQNICISKGKHFIEQALNKI